jgi:hypothetical protein
MEFSPPIFTPRAFDLLAAMALTPKVGFYFDHKAELKAEVERPLQGLMRRAAPTSDDAPEARN